MATFIASDLDDFGLDPFAFRIYCRLCRRAGESGDAYESVPNMAAGCKMSERQARKSLRELEEMGLIVRFERPGNKSIYRLTPAPGAALPPRHTVPGSDSTPAYSAAHPGIQCRPTPAPGAAKGYPLQGNPLKVKKHDTSCDLFEFLPESHQTPEMREAFKEYLDMRKRERYGSWKPKTIEANAKEWATYPVGAVVKALKESTKAPWRGVFPKHEAQIVKSAPLTTKEKLMRNSRYAQA